MDRSTRTIAASFLWIAALFVAMNAIVASSSLGDWAFPLVLAIIGAVLIYLPEARRAAEETTASEVGIGATEWRSDVLAAVAEPSPEEVDDAVENMGSSRVTTLAEVDSLSGPPTDSLTRNPAAEVPAASPVKAAPAASPEPENASALVSITKAPAETHEEAIIETESRSDALAAVAEPSAEELDDTVENVSTISSTLEETEELSGPPTDSQPRRATSEMPVVSAKLPEIPAAPSAPTSADDLTVIEGIGPKMSAALAAAGIDTFAKLAATDEVTLRNAIAAAGMRFAPSLVTWAEQAAYAAKGDWDGLKTFIGTLTAGRRSK